MSKLGIAAGLRQPIVKKTDYTIWDSILYKSNKKSSSLWGNAIIMISNYNNAVLDKKILYDNLDSLLPFENSILPSNVRPPFLGLFKKNLSP